MNIIEKAVDKLLGDKPGQDPGSRKGAAGASPAGSAAPAPPQKPVEDATVQPSRQAEPPSTEQAEAPPAQTPADVAPSPGSADGSSSEAAAAAPDAVASAAPTGVGGGERMIRLADLGGAGVLTPGSERTRAGEEYRMIKRPLLTNAFSPRADGDVHHNLIMCTSSVEGEGKTFTSLNLAISIAMEMDRTVLLVDADLAKPGLSRLLEIDSLPGLTDRLNDQRLDLKDLLLRTDVPKLTILPAGRRHHRSTELLASNNMRALLDELALRYPDRVVLFDSPPLLATSEAGALAQQMGQICVVVESGVTPQFLVKDALGHIGDTDNVSLILNKCKPDLFSDGYGYGYSYRYGYGYGQDDR